MTAPMKGACFTNPAALCQLSRPRSPQESAARPVRVTRVQSRRACRGSRLLISSIHSGDLDESSRPSQRAEGSPFSGSRSSWDLPPPSSGPSPPRAQPSAQGDALDSQEPEQPPADGGASRGGWAEGANRASSANAGADAAGSVNAHANAYGEDEISRKWGSPTPAPAQPPPSRREQVSSRPRSNPPQPRQQRRTRQPTPRQRGGGGRAGARAAAAGGALALLRGLAALATRLVADVAAPAVAIAQLAWGDVRARATATPPRPGESAYFLPSGQGRRVDGDNDDASRERVHDRASSATAAGRWRGREEWAPAPDGELTDEERQIDMVRDVAERAIDVLGTGAQRTWETVTRALADGTAQADQDVADERGGRNRNQRD